MQDLLWLSLFYLAKRKERKQHRNRGKDTKSVGDIPRKG